jgi:tight adherence protein B
MVPLALAAWMVGCFGVFYLSLSAGAALLRRVETRTLAATDVRLEALWMGERLSPQRLLYGSAAVAAVLGVLLGLVVHPVLGVLGAAAVLCVPPLALNALEARRRAAFETQLVDALDGLAGSLRGGFSLEQGLKLLADRAASPLGQELRFLRREMEVGAPLETALAHLEARLPGEDLRLLVVAVTLAREVGGNLAEILGELAVTLRRRREVQGRLKSLTAQGRLQGVVLGAVPVALGAALYVVQPEMMRKFLVSPKGWAVLALAAALETAGILWIRRIVRIDT